MNAASLRLREPDRAHLKAGAAALGVDIGSKEAADFSRFADLLDLWSPKMNLVSCRSAYELVERHFLDSVAVAPALPDDSPIVDLGSGAGFPGIPLAIVRPAQRFVLVETRRRRVTFLREARRTLGLENIEILEQRAEEPARGHRHAGAAVVMRAVSADPATADVAREWLLPGGRFFWMRTDALPEDWERHSFIRERPLRYRIGQSRLRCVEVLRFRGEGLLVSRET